MEEEETEFNLAVAKERAAKKAAQQLAAKKQKEEQERQLSENSKDYRAIFTQAPLGLTLTKSFSGAAEVTRVSEGGQAQYLGVRAGDMLIGINTQWVRGYDEAMGIITTHGYPMPLVFRRGPRGPVTGTASAVIRGSKVSRIGMKSLSSYLLVYLLKLPIHFAHIKIIDTAINS